MAKKSEELYLRSHYLKALASSYLWVFVLAISGFILTPLFLNILGARNFGVYTAIYSVSQYAAIGIGWIGGAAIVAIGGYKASTQNNKLKSAESLVYGAYVLYGVILFVLASLYVMFVNDKIIAICIIVLAFYFLFNYPLQGYFANLTALNEQSAANILRSVQAALFLIASLVGLYFSNSLAVPFAALFISVFTLCVALAVSKKIALPKVGMITKEVVSDFLGKVGKWNFFYSISLLSFGLDAVFLAYCGKAEYAAYYAVIWQIPGFLVILLSKIPEVSQPFMVKMGVSGELKSRKKAYLLQKIAVLAAGLLAGILYTFAGKDIVLLWTGWSGANIDYFAFASLAMIFMLAEKVDSSFVFSDGGYKFLFFLSFAGIGVKFASAYYFLESLHEASVFAGYICYFLTLGVLLQAYSWRRVK